MLTSRNRIGEFDRLITFQEASIGTNDFNEDVQSWDDITSDPDVPAIKKERQGSETFEADQLTEVRSTIFTIRFRSDITVKNRIVDDNGLIYNITSIIETARRRYQDIIAETKGELFLEAEGAFTSGFSSAFNI